MPDMTDDEHAEAGHYECPDCGEWHDGMTTGTELCPDCEFEPSPGIEPD